MSNPGPDGIPNIAIVELSKAFTPAEVRNGDGVYKAVKKRAEEILVQAQKTLRAIEGKLKQVTLRCSGSQQKFVLIGRLAFDERGRKIIVAQRAGAEIGKIVAVNSSGEFVSIGNVRGSVPLLDLKVPFPAGTPCFVPVQVKE